MLQITHVTLYPFDLRSVGSTVRAYAEVTFNDALLLRGLRVMETSAGGLFISYPAQKSPGGEFRDLVAPLTKELKTMIRQAVLEKYRAALPAAPQPSAPPSDPAQGPGEPQPPT